MSKQSLEMSCSRTAADASITSVKASVKRLFGSRQSKRPNAFSPFACVHRVDNDNSDHCLQGRQLPLDPLISQIRHRQSPTSCKQQRISDNLLYKQALVRMQLEARKQKRIETDLRQMVGDVGATLFDPLDLDFLHPDAAANDDKLWHPPSTTQEESKQEQYHHEMVPIPEKPSLASMLTVATEAETYYHDSSSDGEEHHHFPVEVQVESLEDLQTCPRILTLRMMQQLHDEGLPDQLQMHKWVRCFAIGRDGDSFITLLDHCSSFTHTLLVIQTTDGHILGGFASEAWKAEDKDKKKRSRTYYGNGQTFLFANHPDKVSSDIDPSAKELTLFKWTGSNDYNQICDVEQKVLAMGGVGDFGLIVQDDFFRGTTGRCGTFDNPPLVPGGTFEIESFEVYGLVPLIQSFSELPSTTTRSSGSLSFRDVL